jgi:hypothetical protein
MTIGDPEIGWENVKVIFERAPRVNFVQTMRVDE